MELTQAMLERHSVRAFKDEPLAPETADALRKAAAELNAAHGLSFSLVTDEPNAFQANKPSYGSFQNCKNYFVLGAPKNTDEQVGYCGEQLVLLAQSLGVNSCWVALTYKKGQVPLDLPPKHKLYMVIALGYGRTGGHDRKSKTAAEVSDCTDLSPEWYKQGVAAALLAPTAMNQQKFRFALAGDRVTAKAGLGFYARVDLGIAKYHFELGAGKGPDVWA